MQPHLTKRYKSDVYMFDDIQNGDYFFLCCDGVLEQMSNEKLCEILADKKLTDELKLEAIKSVCDGKTRDNYTCWLIPIDKVNIQKDSSVSAVIKAKEENIEVTSVKIIENTSYKQVKVAANFRKRWISRIISQKMLKISSIKINYKHLPKWIWWIVGLLLSVVMLWMVMKKFNICLC